MGEDEEIGTPGLGVMVHGVDQMLADKRSRTSYQREKSLMNKQNAMNLSNAMTMPSIQADGLRMAGFNPAMMNGAGTSPAPTVSKGSADMAQTLPFDVGGLAQLMLLKAQKENVEAQTEKTKAETQVVPTEGEKNQAQVLLYGKQAELTEEQRNKVKEEAQSIANTNKNYVDENAQLKILGSAVMKDLQETDWYKRLPEQLKGYVDQIAAGTTDMTIGALEAFERALGMQKNLDDSAVSAWNNAVLASVAKKQLDRDEVLAAMANTPEAEYRLKDNQAGKTFEEITKVKKEVDKIMSDIGRNGVLNQKDEVTMNHLEKQIQKLVTEIESMNENDYGLLIRDKKYSKAAAIAALNNLGAIIHTVGMFSPGGFVQKLKSLFQGKKPPEQKWFRGTDGKMYPEIRPPKGGFGPTSSISNFRFKSRRFT